MAVPMRHKRSAVAGKVPAVADIQLGELAINTTDGKLYLKKSVGGVETIVAIGGGILTKQFISSEQAITVGGALTLAHGLGVKPKLVTGSLICKVAEAGYSAGDEFNDALTYSYTDAGVPVTNAAICDATSIFLRFQNALGNYRVQHKTTGALTNITTTANWRFIVRAFA